MSPFAPPWYPRRLLWWLSVVVFVASLLLPIKDDWSIWAGGCYAYLMGAVMALPALVAVVGWPVLDTGLNLKPSDLIEGVFLLGWFANPLCHIATALLWRPPSVQERRQVWPALLAGLAFGLALMAGFIDAGRNYASLQRSPAYFAWVGSMGLMLLAALCPRPPNP